jgi:ribose transport system ATP-binding protein
MLGRTLEAMYPAHDPVIGEEVLKVEDIHLANKVKGVSFSVRSGEIVGIAGLIGSGRSETVNAVFGALRMNSGRIFLSGREMQLRSPHQAVHRGMGMVPEDRKRQGVILSLPVKENISLTNLRAIAGRFGFIRSGKEHSNITALIRKLSIKTRDENQVVATLSGGNQQKVVLAKWLNRLVNLWWMNHPWGGWVRSKFRLQNSGKGVAIPEVSSESSELMGICEDSRNAEWNTGRIVKAGISEEGCCGFRLVSGGS